MIPRLQFQFYYTDFLNFWLWENPWLFKQVHLWRERTPRVAQQLKRKIITIEPLIIAIFYVQNIGNFIWFSLVSILCGKNVIDFGS